MVQGLGNVFYHPSIPLEPFLQMVPPPFVHTAHRFHCHGNTSCVRFQALAFPPDVEGAGEVETLQAHLPLSTVRGKDRDNTSTISHRFHHRRSDTETITPK